MEAKPAASDRARTPPVGMIRAFISGIGMKPSMQLKVLAVLGYVFACTLMVLATQPPGVARKAPLHLATLTP